MGLANGTLAVFDPQHPTAGHTHLINISSAPIISCTSLGTQLLVASQSTLYSINTATMDATVSTPHITTQVVLMSPLSLQPILSLPENQLIQFVEGARGETGEEEGKRVWVSVRDRPLLHLYHLPSASLLTSIDCTQKVTDIFRGISTYLRYVSTVYYTGLAFDCRL